MQVAGTKRVRVMRSVCVVMLLVAVSAGAVFVLRRNLASISSDAAGAVLSRALGVPDVQVAGVAAHGIRSIALSGVRVGDGLAAKRVLLAYDFRSLLKTPGSPLLSVTAIRAEGVQADWAALERHFGVHFDGGAGSNEDDRSAADASSTRLRSGKVGSPAFAGIILIRDAVVTIGPSDGAKEREQDKRRIGLKDALLESPAHAGGVWSMSVGSATYRDGHRPELSFELANVRGSLTTSEGAVKVDDFAAQVLGGTVRASFTLRRGGVITDVRAGAGAGAGAGEGASTRILGAQVSGKAALAGVSYNGWVFTGNMATADDGRVQVDGEVDGHMKARLEGLVALPGLTPEATAFSADGIVNVEDAKIGQSRVRGMKLEVSIGGSPGLEGGAPSGRARSGFTVRARAHRTGISQISEALGRPIPAQGWVDWRADGEIGAGGLASVRVWITDGVVRAEGCADDWPHEFTEISGMFELYASASGTTFALAPVGAGMALRVPELSAKVGNGEVKVSGSPELWRVAASGVRVDHQVVSGVIDADLAVRAGKRVGLSGRATVRNAEMDLVVAGIQSGVPVPEADLDIDIEVGDGVRIVRGESWAWALPGTIHVQGRTRRPVASGSLNLSSGQIDVHGVPLEVVSGEVRFTGTPGDPPEFSLVARDVASESPVIISIAGVPGNVRIAVRPEDGSDGEEVLEGDLLVKLLMARLRLYMLGGLGQALDGIDRPGEPRRNRVGGVE